MAHKFLRNREHHKALEARFTPGIPLFPGSNDPDAPAAPTTTPNSDPTPGGQPGGILTPILNPPGTPSIPIQQQQQPPPVFQTTTSTAIVRGPPVVTTPVAPVASTINPSLATLNTSTSLSTISSAIPTPVFAQTIPSTSLTPTSTRQVATESTVFTTVTPSSIFSGSSSIPSVTPSQTPTSSGLGTGPIVGLAAAGVAGIAVLGVAGIWLFKKYVSHKDEPIDEGNFTRHSWMRNSVALNDDSADGAGAGAGVAGLGATSQQNPNARPRPPTMIERHQANFTAMRGHTPTPPQQQGLNYSDNMAGYGYGGYETPGGYDSPYNAAVPAVPPAPLMRSLSPGQTYPVQDLSPQPYHNPIASPPPLGHSPAPSNGSAAYASAASAPVSYFTRHNSPTSPPPTGPLPDPYVEGSNAGYANMERSASITAFQQQTYNEISQQLERSPFADPAIPAPPLSPVRSGTVQVVNVSHVHAGQETPVQFGYNDSQTAQPVATNSQPKRSGSVTSKKSTGRPETMYDEEDAYGGI